MQEQLDFFPQLKKEQTMDGWDVVERRPSVAVLVPLHELLDEYIIREVLGFLSASKKSDLSPSQLKEFNKLKQHALGASVVETKLNEHTGTRHYRWHGSITETVNDAELGKHALCHQFSVEVVCDKNGVVTSHEQ